MNNTLNQYQYMLKLEERALGAVERVLGKSEAELSKVTALAKSGCKLSYKRMLSLRLDVAKLVKICDKHRDTIASLKSEISKLWV